MAGSVTKRSTLRLSEVARHVVIPSGVVSTAWPDVRGQCEEWGDRFDVWQDGAGAVMLAKRSNGKYAATVGGITLSIPRQVAKTFLVGRVVFALCALHPGFTVLWSAHRTRTSTRTFQSLQAFAKRKKVFPLIEHIRSTNGEQEIGFRNGSAILFGAREQGFGRGFEEIDAEVFDEAQILTEKALDDMVAATNQTRHPAGALLFFMGTPPRPSDPGEAFSLKRVKALSGKARDMVYIECSADPDADPDDRAQWEKANPSYPHRTPLESMLRLRENLPSDDSWRREALGIWDALGTNRVIPEQSWADQRDEHSTAVDRVALGVEVGPDLACASVCLAGVRADGGWHVELDERRDGAAWLAPYVEKMLAANPRVRGVVVDVAGPVSALLEKRGTRWLFKGTQVEVTPMRVAELGAGCSSFLDGVVTGWLWHIGQPQLSVAAGVAGKRVLGDTGLWVWSRKSATSDITPVQAATWALVGAQSNAAKRPVRSGSRGKVVVLT